MMRKRHGAMRMPVRETPVIRVNDNRVGGVELFPRRPLTPPTVPFGSGRFLKFYFHSRGLAIRLSQHHWCFARNFGFNASLTIGVLVERQ